MKTFENYLQHLHAKDYMGTDDDMSDRFNDWLEQFDVNDILEMVKDYEKIKGTAAVELGKLGGKARAKKYTKEQLSEMGKKGGWPSGKKRKHV